MAYGGIVCFARVLRVILRLWASLSLHNPYIHLHPCKRYKPDGPSLRFDALSALGMTFYSSI